MHYLLLMERMTVKAEKLQCKKCFTEQMHRYRCFSILTLLRPNTFQRIMVLRCFKLVDQLHVCMNIYIKGDY